MITHKNLFLAAEVVAVILSLSYTFLYIHFANTGGNIALAYLPAFFGSIVFMLLTYQKKIYAESGLHFFYILFAVYGFFATSSEWYVVHSELPYHLPYILFGTIAVAGLGWCLKRKTDAKTPYLDAFTSVFSLIATWLMIHYVHENWLYWIVIDLVAIFLYGQRKMYISALLFALFLIMAVDGYFESIQLF